MNLLTARTTDCKQVTCTDSNHITVLSPVSCVLRVQVSIHSKQPFTLQYSLIIFITWSTGGGQCLFVWLHVSYSLCNVYGLH